MGYGLAVDLGTTCTTAAVERDGRVATATLGDRTTAVPSVLLLRPDGTVLTGDAAERGAAGAPDRVVRGVGARLGDPVPVLVGGTPHPVPELMAHQLRDVLRMVGTQEGAAPDTVTLTHPATWGPYERERFGQVHRAAGIDDARVLTEPEAAVAHLASTGRVPDGALVAVHDLGGGSVDATVLRVGGAGATVLGVPGSAPGLGGAGLDDVVFAHVDRALDGAVSAHDPADARAAAAVVRLRQDCVLAKEALSTDTETVIPVVLPSVQTAVLLTRGELEEMIRPWVGATVAVLRRALRSADVTPDDLHTVLLTGGSARIPAMAGAVAGLGRPPSVGRHPEHAVALGAASWGAERTGAPGRAGGPGSADRPGGAGGPSGAGGTRDPGEAGGTSGAGSGAAAPDRRRRGRVVLGAGVLVVAAAAGGGLLYGTSGGTPPGAVVVTSEAPTVPEAGVPPAGGSPAVPVPAVPAEPAAPGSDGVRPTPAAPLPGAPAAVPPPAPGGAGAGHDHH